MTNSINEAHEKLYHQLLLVNERMSWLVREGILRWGSDAEEAQKIAWKTYGHPVQLGTPLRAIVDPTDINGWLQETVFRVECREAEFMSQLAQRVGDEGYYMGWEVYHKKGRQAGLDERVGMDTIRTPEDIYRAFIPLLVNGMPSDVIDEGVAKGPDIFQWRKKYIPQRIAWKKTTVDMMKMEKLYAEWVRGFFVVFSDVVSYQDDHEGESILFTLKRV